MTSSSEIVDSELFRKRLSAYRIKKGFNQKQMCEFLGCTYSTYNQWENGGRLPRMQKLNEISEILGIPTTYLMGVDPKKDDGLTSMNSLPLVEGGLFINENTPAKVMLKGLRYNPIVNVSPEIFAYEVKDHAMSRATGKTINAGMICICSRKFQPQEIKHAVVCLSIKNGEGIIREINFDGDNVIISAWNPNYAEQVISQADLVIWGKVIKTMQDL